MCPQDNADLPPSGQVAPLNRSKRSGETTVSVPPSRRKQAKYDQGLATRVQQLSTELAEMKSLLQTYHSDASLPTAGLSSPPMPDLSADVLSLAASAFQFRDEEEVQSSQASETGSFSSQSAVGEPSDGSMQEVMCMAFRLLAGPKGIVTSFHRRPNERLLAALAIPWHISCLPSASLQDAGGATAAVGFSDAALQAFVLMTIELCHVMSFLVQGRRQVWLEQSPLTKACHRTLRIVPVVPGELFESAAVEVLEQTVQARQTSQQLSGLRSSMPPPPPQRQNIAVISGVPIGVAIGNSGCSLLTSPCPQGCLLSA
ncbi:hypothetical protein GOODEAATRI_015567 [Goodea atripinnis]|uniref:Uncharacterized protein n=1 Tax=Goodea atripinnis TaxID=208336 RepID=A0ABV0NUU6_9TELE